MRRHLVGLASFAILLVFAGAAAPSSNAPSPQKAGLSPLDRALVAHTELAPVVRGRRVMAGDNFRASGPTFKARLATPTPGVTQNGTCNDQKAEANVGDTRTLWVHNF